MIELLLQKITLFNNQSAPEKHTDHVKKDDKMKLLARLNLFEDLNKTQCLCGDNDRNLHIDTLRGLACFLLVAFHVVGADSGSGLKIASGHYRDINDFLAYVRMPLFTFISGIVYAYRPFSGQTWQYIQGKLRRLILPMLVVGTIFAVLQSLTPGSNGFVQNWYLLHIEPIAHYWFLEAIFIIFLVMIPLELVKAFKTKRRFLGIFFLALTLYFSNVYLHYFSISGAIYLLPYFLLGMGLQRFSFIDKLQMRFGILLFIGVAVLMSLGALGILSIQPERTALGLVISAAACVGLLSLKRKSHLLAKIGYFSYSIYLYHVFFTAALRIALNKLGLNDVNVLFCAAVGAGILLPILTERVFDGANVTRVFLLGKSRTDKENLWLAKHFPKKFLPNGSKLKPI